MVGRVTPCAPGLERLEAARTVTRPTLKCIGDGLVMGGWFYSGGTTFSRLDGTPRSSARKSFSTPSCPQPLEDGGIG